MTSPASIKQVADYLRREGESLTDFSAQWKELTDAEKEQIREGIGSGSFTY